MMQQSINQMLGTLGLATKLSPELEKKAKLKSLQEGENVIQKELDIANKARTKAVTNLSTTTEKRRQLHEEAGEIEEQKYQNYKEQFQLNPTSDIFNKMLMSQRDATRSRTTANELAKLKIENAVNQDNDFKKLHDSIILNKYGESVKVNPESLMKWEDNNG